MRFRATGILLVMSTQHLRWGADAPQDLAAARSRLIDAAEVCFGRIGIAKATVEDVAREAKVSRATVYRYFEGRDDLVLAVLLRDTDRHLARIRPRMEQLASLAEVIVEFVVLTERAARRDPSLSLLFAADHASLAGGIIAGASLVLFERVTEFFRPFFARWSAQVRPGVDAAGASEWVLRALLSFLAVRGPQLRTPDGQRRYLRTYLVPAVCS